MEYDAKLLTAIDCKGLRQFVHSGLGQILDTKEGHDHLPTITSARDIFEHRTPAQDHVPVS